MFSPPLQDGRVVVIEFPEYLCENIENERRREHGEISDGFACLQLSSKRTIYRDQEDEPCRISVRYRAGCELRCVNDNCNTYGFDNNNNNHNVTHVGRGDSGIRRHLPKAGLLGSVGKEVKNKRTMIGISRFFDALEELRNEE